MTLQASARAAIFATLPSMTAAERRLAQVLLADYPFAALHSVAELAEQSEVSAPTISRFVAKLGFSGYAEFQRSLIDEMREAGRSPLDLAGSEAAPGSYAARGAQVLAQMEARTPPGEVEAVARLLADPARRLFLLGGRITDHFAGFLAVHLQQIRDGVTHLPRDAAAWPPQMLRMRRQDVLVLFDVRRYQPDLAALASRVRAERGAQVVLITDTWLSPIARTASHVFALPIEIGTAWDTCLALLALAEDLIVRASDADWPAARTRLEALDALRMTGEKDA